MPTYALPSTTQATDYASLFGQLSGGGGLTSTMVNPAWGAGGIQHYLNQTAQYRGQQQAALGGAQLANLQSQQTGNVLQQALMGLGAGISAPQTYAAPLFQYSGQGLQQVAAPISYSSPSGVSNAQGTQTNVAGVPTTTYTPTTYTPPTITAPTPFNAPNPNDIANTPEYQFALQQGQTAVDRSMGARGLSQSGNRLAALTQFGQGLASQQYQNAYQNALAGYTANTSAQQQAAALQAQTGLAAASLNAGTGFNAASLNAQQQQFAGSLGLQQQQLTTQQQQFEAQLAAQQQQQQAQLQFATQSRDIEAQQAAASLNMGSMYQAAALNQQGQQAYNSLLANLGIQSAGLLMQGTAQQQEQQTEALGQQTYANMIQGLIQGLMPQYSTTPMNPQTGTWRSDPYNNAPQNLVAYGSPQMQTAMQWGYPTGGV